MRGPKSGPAKAVSASLPNAGARASTLKPRAASARRQELAATFMRAFEHVPVGIAHNDLEGRFLRVNRKLSEMLGYSAEELLGKSIMELSHPEDRGSQHRAVLDVIEGRSDSLSGERRLLRKDGSVVWVNRTMTLARAASDAESYLIQVIEDITERKRNEARIARLNHARLVMAGCTMAIVRAATEPELFQEICRNLVESGGYRQAWIGLAVDDAAKSIRISGAAGYEPGYIESRALTWGSDSGRQGVMGHVIASGKPYIAQNILTDERFSRRRVRALEKGYQSSITLPLKVEGRCVGGISIYAAEADAFDPDEIALLTVLADDIAFGVSAIRTREAREEAESRSRDNARRFQHAFNQAAVGIVHADLDRNILEANQKFCEMVGYDAEEVLRMNLRQVSHPDDLGQDARPRAQLIAGEIENFSSEKRYVRKDGRVIWVRRTASLARDEAGDPRHFIFVVEDVTERKELERRFELTFDRAAVGMALGSLDGRYLLVNQRFAGMLGYSREELKGRAVLDLVLSEDHAEMGRLRKKLLSGELDSTTDERRYIRKDGRVIWTRRTLSLARDSTGTPLYFIGVAEDITASKEREERYRTIFANAAVGITHVDLEGILVDVNQKFCDMLGYAKDELLGKAIKDITYPDDYAQGFQYRAQLAQGTAKSAGGEKRFVRKDGAIIWARRTISAAFDDAGKPQYLISVVEDITERKQAEQALRDGEERYRNLFELAPLPLLVMDEATLLLLAANRAAVEKYGYAHEEFLSMTILDLQLEEDRANVAQQLRQRDPHKSAVFQRRHATKSGEVILVEVTARPFVFHGRQSRILLVNDISERKRAETALQESEEQFRQLAGNIPQVFWITDVLQREMIYVSPAYERITGRPIEPLKANARDWLKIVHEEDRERVKAARKTALSAQYDEVFRVVRPDGTIRWVRDRAFPVRDAEGKVYRITGIAEDITERREAEERLKYLAHYDALTSLPNRVLFYDRLKQELAHARRNNWVVAVMFIDLDRFKNVNDTLGHGAGDRLLRQVSERLTGCVRTGDTVGRLGGDEFAIVLSNIGGPRDASVVAQKIMASLSDPFQLQRNEVFITTSIGITLFPTDSPDQDTLIRNADTAMYRAKELGRNSCQFYTPEMNARALEKLSLESSLRRALERREFVLYFQPKVSLASGEITGVEALLRWRHPDLGLVSPVDFMPMLEETGLIVPTGEWVIRAACAQVRSWQQAGIKPVPVAVNLSARQFQSRDLGATISRILEEERVRHDLLELEITESSIANNTEEAAETLAFLNALGVRVAIDDFGTGHSSLSRLKRFPLDALKIDSSFVRDITTDADDAAITRAIITMAHSLGLAVVAEGVETEQQLNFLSANGCDEIQGYYFSTPLSAEDCTALIRSGQRLPRPGRNALVEPPAALLAGNAALSDR